MQPVQVGSSFSVKLIDQLVASTLLVLAPYVVAIFAGYRLFFMKNSSYQQDAKIVCDDESLDVTMEGLQLQTFKDSKIVAFAAGAMLGTLTNLKIHENICLRQSDWNQTSII